MGARGNELAQRNFDLDLTARLTSALYERVLSETKRK